MTERSPVISVVMAVFNGERYLRKAIDSVLRQTYGDFELIVVNDGSTDKSADILLSINDRRLKVMHNHRNEGLISSLNKGLYAARGEFIARMDADDVARPKRFEKQLRAFINEPGLAVCGCNYISRGGLAYRRSRARGEDTYLKSLLIFATCFSHPTVMIRRSALGKQVYDAGAKHVEDYKLWVDLSETGSYRILPEALLVYRVHASQVTQTYREEQKKISAEIRRAYLQWKGFSFSPEQLKVHNRLGDNVTATTLHELQMMESWLKELLRENDAKKIFGVSGFNGVIHKYWIDACGNTTLGLGAFRAALASPLSDIGPFSRAQRFTLFAKCMIRQLFFKK